MKPERSGGSRRAIIRNPWFGRGYVENLKPDIRETGPELGKLLTGMILDVTHLSEPTFWDALEVYDGPVWASHHNCRALVDDPRRGAALVGFRPPAVRSQGRFTRLSEPDRIAEMDPRVCP